MGKPLSLWLRTYAPSSSAGRGSREWSQADDAVRHMGTNCIPTLLSMLRQRDSKIKLNLVALAQKHRVIKVHFVPAAERNAEASKAFLALGGSAKGAVPALLKMCNESISADSQLAIEDTFAGSVRLRNPPSLFFCGPRPIPIAGCGPAPYGDWVKSVAEAYSAISAVCNRAR